MSSRNKKNTKAKFNKYMNAVCDILKISKTLYRQIKNLIIKYFGYFDENKTYCGPGWLGDWIVPDLIFSFAGYVHDAIYFLIENRRLEKKLWKKKADRWFFAIMDTRSNSCKIKFLCKFASRVYYRSVWLLGNPKRKKRGSRICV